MQDRDSYLPAEEKHPKNSLRSLCLLGVFSVFLVGVLYFATVWSEKKGEDSYKDLGDAVYTVAGNLASWDCSQDGEADTDADSDKRAALEAAAEAYIKAHNTYHAGQK